MGERVSLHECEYCTDPVSAIVRAQWTIVDFDDRAVCFYHVRHAVALFQIRRVDGQYCKELFVDWLYGGSSDNLAPTW